MSFTASAIAALVAPALRSASPADELWPASESSRCSTVMKESPASRASCSAARRTARTSGSVDGPERGERVQRRVHVDGHADPLDDLPRERVVGAHERGQEMDRLDLRVLALGRQRDRGLDGLAGLLGELVELHQEESQISVGETKIVAAPPPRGNRLAARCRGR
jgi:hypothetical protein